MEQVAYDLVVRTAKADAAIAASAKRARELFERKGLQLNVKAANLPLGRITGDFNKFSDSLDAAASRVLAFTATTTAIYGMAQAFTNLFTASIKLEAQLASIQSIFQTSSSNLASFSTDLLKIANATGQSFDVAAEAAKEFARQGLSVQKTMEATTAAMTFSRIAGVGVTQAVENLTASLNTFNEEALEYKDVVDTITNLDNNFAVSAAGIAEGLKRVGSVASEAGIEFKEIASLISVVQQVSARGAPVISNGLKTIFTRLGRSGVQDALEAIGVGTKDANGEFRKQIDVLSDLANTLESLSDSQKAFILEQVGGVYQINTLQSTLKALSGEYSLFDKAVGISTDSAGSAAARLKILTDTTDSSLKVLKNNFNAFSAQAGKVTVKPLLDNFVGIGNTLLDGLLKTFGGGQSEIEGQGAETGSKLGNALIGGIQSVLAGPGTALLVITLGKLLTKLSGDALKAIAVLSGLKKVSITDSETQKAVNTAILNGNKLLIERLRTTNDIVVKTQTLNSLLTESAIKQQSFQINSLVAAGLSNAGRKAGTPRPGKAAGFIPNFNEGQVLESVGAKEHGYKAGKAYETRIHDGTGKSRMSYVNSAEKVINFKNSDGKKATMVVPPNGFGKGTTYAAEGFVPNFVSQNKYEQFLKARGRGKEYIGEGSESVAFRKGNDVSKFPRNKRMVSNSLGKNKFLKGVDWGKINKTLQETEPNIVFPAVRPDGIGQSQKFAGQTVGEAFKGKGDALTYFISQKFGAVKRSAGGSNGIFKGIEVDYGSSGNITVLGKPNFNPEDTVEQIYSKNKFAVIDPAFYYNSGFVPNFALSDAFRAAKFAGSAAKQFGGALPKGTLANALKGNLDIDSMKSRLFDFIKNPSKIIKNEKDLEDAKSAVKFFLQNDTLREAFATKIAPLVDTTTYDNKKAIATDGTTFQEQYLKYKLFGGNKSLKDAPKLFTESEDEVLSYEEKGSRLRFNQSSGDASIIKRQALIALETGIRNEEGIRSTRMIGKDSYYGSSFRLGGFTGKIRKFKDKYYATYKDKWDVELNKEEKKYLQERLSGKVVDEDIPKDPYGTRAGERLENNLLGTNTYGAKSLDPFILRELVSAIPKAKPAEFRGIVPLSEGEFAKSLFSKGFVPNYAEFPIQIGDFAGGAIRNANAEKEFYKARKDNYNVEFDDRINSVGYTLEKINFPQGAENSRFVQGFVKKTGDKDKDSKFTGGFENVAIRQLRGRGYNFKRAQKKAFGGPNSAVDGYQVNLPSQSVSLLEVKSGDWDKDLVANKFGRFLPENIAQLGPELKDLFLEGDRSPDVTDKITLRNILAVPDLSIKNYRGGVKKDKAGREIPGYDDFNFEKIEEKRLAEEVSKNGLRKTTSNLNRNNVFLAPNRQTLITKAAANNKKGGGRFNSARGAFILSSLQAQKDRGEFAKGFVPNFASPLEAARNREMQAGYKVGQVKVAKSRTLVNPLNPEGLGVYNSDEGSLTKGMSLAKRAGIDPKTKGINMKASGFIPNFAGNQNQRKAERKAQRKARKARKAIPNSETGDGGTITLDAVVGNYVPPQSSINLPQRTSRFNKNLKGSAIRRNLVFKGTTQDNTLPSPSSRLDNSSAFANSKGVSAAFDKIKAPKDAAKRIGSLEKQAKKAEKAGDTAKATDLKKQIELEKRSAVGVDSANKILKLKADLKKAEEKGNTDKTNRLKRELDAENKRFAGKGIDGKRSPEQVARISALNSARQLQQQGISPFGPSISERARGAAGKAKNLFIGRQDDASVQKRQANAGRASFAAFGLTALSGTLLGPEEGRTEGQKKAANGIESLGTAATTAGLLGFGPLAIAIGAAVGGFQFFTKTAKMAVGSIKDSEKGLDALKTGNEKEITASALALEKKSDIDQLQKSGASPEKIVKARREYIEALSEITDRNLAREIQDSSNSEKVAERVAKFQEKKQKEVQSKEGFVAVEKLGIQRGEERVAGVDGALSGAFQFLSNNTTVKDNGGFFDSINKGGKEFFDRRAEELKAPKKQLGKEDFGIGLDPILKQITLTQNLSKNAAAGLENLSKGIYDLPQFLQRFGAELGLTQTVIDDASKSFTNLNKDFHLDDFEAFAAEAIRFQSNLSKNFFPQIELKKFQTDFNKLFKTGITNLTINQEIGNIRSAGASKTKVALEENQFQIDSTNNKFSGEEKLIQQANFEKRNSKLGLESRGQDLLIDAVKKLAALAPEDTAADKKSRILDTAQSVLTGEGDLADLEKALLDSVGKDKTKTLLEEIKKINVEIATTSAELSTENQTSNDIIAGLLKQNVEQLKRQAIKDLASNVLSGESQKGLTDLKGRDRLGEVKLAEEIAKLEKKAASPQRTPKEKNTLLQQAATKNVELQRLIDRGSKAEEAAGGAGFVSSKVSEDQEKKLADRTTQEGLAVQAKAFAEAINLTRKGTDAGAVFSAESIEKITLKLREGDKDGARGLIEERLTASRLVSRSKDDELTANPVQGLINTKVTDRLSKLISDFLEIGGKDSPLFGRKAAVTEESSTPLSFESKTARVTESTLKSGATSKAALDELKKRPEIIEKYEKAVNDYNRSSRDLISFQAETLQLAKNGQLSPEGKASRGQEEERLTDVASTKKTIVEALKTKAAPDLRKEEATAKRPTDRLDFRERPKVTVDAKTIEVKNPKVTQAEKQTAAPIKVDNQKLEQSIDRLTTAFAEFSKASAPSTSSTKIDQNFTFSVDVTGGSLTNEQANTFRLKMLAEVEAIVRDLQNGKTSPPKKQ